MKYSISTQLYLSKKILVFSTLFFLTGVTFFAQGQQSSDRLEAQTLMEKAKLSLSRGNNDASIGFGLLGLDKAESLSDNQLILEFKDLLGDIYLANEDYKRSIYFFLDVTLNAERLNDIELTANGYFSLGNVYSSMKAYDKATDSYVQAYTLFERDNNALSMAEAAQAMGYNYILSNQKLKTIDAFELLYKISKEEDIKIFQNLANQQLLNAYQHQENTELAIKHGLEYYLSIAYGDNKREIMSTAHLLSKLYLKTNDFIKAEEYSNIAINGNPDNSDYLESLGLAFQGQEKITNAFTIFNRALNMNLSRKNEVGVVRNYNQLAYTQYINKDDRSSLLYLKKAETIGKKINSSETLSETYNVYFKLYDRRGNNQQANGYKVKYESYKALIAQASDNKKTIFKEQEVLADNYEKEARIQISEIQNHQLAQQQDVLKSQQERQQLTLLEQKSLLQDQELKRKALETERAKQNLLIAQQQFDKQQNELELSQLQREAELRKLSELESQKALELSEKERLILEQETQLQASKIEADNQAKILLYSLSGLALLVLIVVIIAFYRTYSSRKIITTQNKNLENQQKQIHQRNIELKKSAESSMVMNKKLQAVQQNLQQTLKKEQLIRSALQKTNKNLKDTQVHLVQAEKMSSLGQLTAGIAHEINNPINFVSSGVESLKENISELWDSIENYKKICQLDNIDDIKKYYNILNEDEDHMDDLRETTDELFNDVQYGTERISEIVLGLKNFSRQGEAEIKETDIHENFEAALLILKSKYKNKAEIIRDFDMDLPLVECFPGQLNQVFVNLIGNAVDAIEVEGTITIKTIDLNENQIEIRIIDSGQGIPEDKKEKIFDPFFTTKEIGKGTGLGLSISHGIIEKHQGVITVESQIGIGTTFIITLPKQLKQVEKTLEATI